MRKKFTLSNNSTTFFTFWSNSVGKGMENALPYTAIGTQIVTASMQGISYRNLKCTYSFNTKNLSEIIIFTQVHNGIGIRIFIGSI